MFVLHFLAYMHNVTLLVCLNRERDRDSSTQFLLSPQIPTIGILWSFLNDRFHSLVSFLCSAPVPVRHLHGREALTHPCRHVQVLLPVSEKYSGNISCKYNEKKLEFTIDN